MRDAQITDINLNEMKISYHGKQAVIAFDPPMKSFSEARERLVQMDQDALKALGRSDIPITKFIPCYTNIYHLLNFSICITTLVVFSSASNFKPGSLLFNNLFFRFPGFANFCLNIQPYLFGIMLCIHTVESTLMVNKLTNHGLTPADTLWWQWAGTCFVEGFTSFRRLNGLIKERKEEKEAKKH